MRMVDPAGVEGFEPRKGNRTIKQLKRELGRPTDLRMFSIAQVSTSLCTYVQLFYEDHLFLDTNVGLP